MKTPEKKPQEMEQDQNRPVAVKAAVEDKVEAEDKAEAVKAAAEDKAEEAVKAAAEDKAEEAVKDALGLAPAETASATNAVTSNPISQEHPAPHRSVRSVGHP